MNLFSRKKKETPPTFEEKTVSVLMQDGSVEEYPETFIITDGENCVVCNSKMYHTNLDCEYLKTEMSGNKTLKAMYVTDAKSKGFSYCYRCSVSNKLHENF